MKRSSHPCLLLTFMPLWNTLPLERKQPFSICDLFSQSRLISMSPLSICRGRRRVETCKTNVWSGMRLSPHFLSFYKLPSPSLLILLHFFFSFSASPSPYLPSFPSSILSSLPPLSSLLPSFSFSLSPFFLLSSYFSVPAFPFLLSSLLLFHFFFLSPSLPLLHPSRCLLFFSFPISSSLTPSITPLPSFSFSLPSSFISLPSSHTLLLPLLSPE